MSDDERVLRSFIADDEELLGIWTVTKASHSKGTIAPRHGTEQPVAVTDERVCWFADELNEVSIDAIGRTDLDYVSQTAAPPMVMGGGLLFILGVFGSIGALIAGVGDVFVLSMPALTGLAIFLGSRVVASVTDREGETRAGYRLTLWTDDEEVAIWSDEEATMEEIDETIAEVAGEGLARDADERTDAGAGDDSTDSDEDVDVSDGEDADDGEKVADDERAADAADER